MPAITFATSICPVTIEYTARKVIRLKLHSREAEVVAHDSGEAPAWLQQLIETVQQHMVGECQDFQDVTLDLSGRSDFARSVYAALRAVPAGETISYGGLAAQVGRPSAARGVASVMAANPIPLIIPCHRVVGANGRLTGFSGAEGIATKAQLLAAEGIPSVDGVLRGSDWNTA